MTVDLFAGLAVSDYQRALTWYERLLGSGPAFFPNPTEAVWELAEHRPRYLPPDQERALLAALEASPNRLLAAAGQPVTFAEVAAGARAARLGPGRELRRHRDALPRRGRGLVAGR